MNAPHQPAIETPCVKICVVDPETGSPVADGEPGEAIEVAGQRLQVVHTPGHSPGCGCLYHTDSNTVVSGDTVFGGGPGATGRSYSDEPTILRSIRDRLLVLPDHTVVHTGHGDSTTIGAERARVLDRIAEAVPDAADECARLAGVLEIVRRHGVPEPMVDMGVVRDWAYYSGVVIEAYAAGATAPVAASQLNAFEVIDTPFSSDTNDNAGRALAARRQDPRKRAV